MSTFQTFKMACTNIQSHIVIRNLRRVFSDVKTIREIIAHKLILQLEGNSEDGYNRTVESYGAEGQQMDEMISLILLKWCLTGDCSSPR